MNFNKDKRVFSVDKIHRLGYEVQYNEIRPDPARLLPLRDIPEPENLKIQSKVVGLFSYYLKWIKIFSEKIRPLSSNTTFLLAEPALDALSN